MDEDELPDDIYDRVTELSEKGNIALNAGDAAGAIAYWSEALKLLPSPQSKWEAALWLHASIGDALRQQGRLEEALSAFQSAYASAEGHFNPFVQVSLGMTLLDLGRAEEATDPLLRAYMMEGEEIFRGSDPKYLDHLAQRRLLDR